MWFINKKEQTAFNLDKFDMVFIKEDEPVEFSNEVEDDAVVQQTDEPTYSIVGQKVLSDDTIAVLSICPHLKKEEAERVYKGVTEYIISGLTYIYK